jgi:chromosome segregation ATPase
MLDLTCHISFSDVQKRYSMRQSTLSNRIKSLGLQTKRQGRNTYLTLKQLSLLDDLNKFLQENPSKTIDEFLSLQNVELQSIQDNLTKQNPLKINESSTNLPDVDVSRLNNCSTDESRINQNLPQIKKQITHILKRFSRIEGNEDFVTESIINLIANEQINEKDREIAELNEELNELYDDVEEAKHFITNLQQTLNEAVSLLKVSRLELDIKKQECAEWKELYIVSKIN